VKFYWARDYFPNFVEEDRRVMVSYDGYIYFSALEKIDRGNYSCSVQSSVSNQVKKASEIFLDLWKKMEENWNYKVTLFFTIVNSCTLFKI
jgi:hypothetical protein